MNRPEKDILFRKVFTIMTHPGHSGELTERPIESLKHAIGSLATVFCNEFPDIL